MFFASVNPENKDKTQNLSLISQCHLTVTCLLSNAPGNWTQNKKDRDVVYDGANRQRCLCMCVCVRGERASARGRERGLIRIKSNLAKTSNPQYRSFRAVRLLCKETARQRLTDLSLKPFYLMVAYSPGIQYAFMHDSSGNNLNYYSGRNHFRNTPL